MTTPTPDEAELAALARIAGLLATHNVAGLSEALAAERPNLRHDNRALSQLNNLLKVLEIAPGAFAREHEKLDAVLNPPEPAEMPGPDDPPGEDDPPAAPGEGE